VFSLFSRHKPLGPRSAARGLVAKSASLVLASAASSTSVLNAGLLIAAPLEAVTITLYQQTQAKGRFWLSVCLLNLPLGVTVLTTASLLVPIALGDALAIAWVTGWTAALASMIAAVAISKRMAGEAADAG
jgi:hypothetical protein